jgi:hypothetical protein
VHPTVYEQLQFPGASHTHHSWLQSPFTKYEQLLPSALHVLVSGGGNVGHEGGGGQSRTVQLQLRPEQVHCSPLQVAPFE